MAVVTIDVDDDLVRFLEAHTRQPAPPKLDSEQLTLFRALGSDPVHPDELSARTGLSASSVATALLTLSLGDVVVEGPPGLFRRKQSP